MYASRHAGIWTEVKVLLLLHIFQSPNYKDHIFIWPNKTNEISSHLQRSTEHFSLLFTSDSVKISVFNSNFHGCAPSPSSPFSWRCPSSHCFGEHQPPPILPWGIGVGPSQWLKVSCACHLHPKPRLKSAIFRDGPQGVTCVHIRASTEYLFSSLHTPPLDLQCCLYKMLQYAVLSYGMLSLFCCWEELTIWTSILKSRYGSIKIMKFLSTALSQYLQLLRSWFCFVTTWQSSENITLPPCVRAWGCRGSD